MKQLLSTKGISQTFQSLSQEVLIEIEVDTVENLELIIEHSQNGCEFKNFFKQKVFIINKAAQYNFKLTRDVLFTRINWISGKGKLSVLFLSLPF